VDVLTVLIAVAMGVVIWRASVWVLRMLASPPDEIDPEDVSETLAHYRCSVCGAEVTMTLTNNVEVSNPRHCREDMTLVWRPESTG
jgi:hypothetical protein